MTTFLADTFRDLANDPSWPSNNVGFGLTAGRIAVLKLDKAKLALMVVEEMYKRCGSVNWAPTLMDSVIKSQHIDPADYANVKKRVEEVK